jgi:hypothetical protein
MTARYLLWTVPFAGLLALHVVGQHRLESDLAALRRERAAPSMSDGTLRAQARAEVHRAAAALAPASCPPHAADAPACEADAPPKPPPIEAAEMQERFEASFSRQAADAGAGDARRKIENRVAAILPDTSRLQAVECRTSMCRIEIAHPGLESYQAFTRAAFLDPSTRLGDGGLFSTVRADPVDGKLVTLSYLARDGEELPRVAEQPE